MQMLKHFSVSRSRECLARSRRHECACMIQPTAPRMDRLFMQPIHPGRKPPSLGTIALIAQAPKWITRAESSPAAGWNTMSLLWCQEMEHLVLSWQQIAVMGSAFHHARVAILPSWSLLLMVM